MTRAENQTNKKNFEIGPNGEIIVNGVVLKARHSAPKNNIEVKNETIAAEKPQKRMRHLNGSFLASSEVDTEKDIIEKQIT